MKRAMLMPALVLFVGGLIAGPATLALAQGETPICIHPAEQGAPDISGDKVVWHDGRAGCLDVECDSYDLDIYMHDLATGEEVPICTTAGSIQACPSISGDKVVWQSGEYPRDIYMYDLSTGLETPVCTDAANQQQAVISGDRVVWADWRTGNPGIYMYDLATGTEVPICTNPATPAISGDRVVWTDWRNGNPDIYMYDIATGTEAPICINLSVQEQPAISGDRVVWTDSRNGNPDIYMYDIATGTEVPICTHQAGQREPAISGDKVVWKDFRNGRYGDGNFDIYMYDLVTCTEVPVCTAPSEQGEPAISGDRIVWTDWRSEDPGSGIYMFVLSGSDGSPAVPSGPTPADGAFGAGPEVELAWTCSDPDPGDTLNYNVYVWEPGDLAPAVVLAFGHPDTSYTVSGLKPTTTYTWKVIPQDNYGEQAEGPVWSFTTGNFAYDPTPADGAGDLGWEAALAWTCSEPEPGDTLTFDVYLAPQGQPLALVATDLTAPSCVVNGLERAATYNWKILLKHSSGGQAESQLWSFATADFTANPIPAAGASDLQHKVDLAWTCGTYAPGDEFEVYLWEQGQTRKFVGRTQDTSRTVRKLRPNTVYEWQVRLLHSEEDETVHKIPGPVWSFTTGDYILIKRVGPRLSEPAQRIRIIGYNFGETQGDSVVHINGKAFGPDHPRINFWSDTKIVMKLPRYKCDFFKGEASRPRRAWVTVRGLDSNRKPFMVARPATCQP